MVDLGKRIGERATEKSMEMGTERSRPSLHNFKMPRLQWGKQKLLRCINVDEDDEILKSSALGVKKMGLVGRIESEHERRRWIEKIEWNERLNISPPPSAVWMKSKADNDGIEAIREKLMFNLQEMADKMDDAILREGLEEEEPRSPEEAPAPSDAVCPGRLWNLRTRRAACKAPNGVNGAIGCSGTDNGGVARGLKFDGRRRPNFSPLGTEAKSSRLGGNLTAEGPAGEKRERPKFSVALTRREIEEDFRVMTGNRPPRRPKKRPKIVQRELDTLFPGLWLTEVTADIYKLRDGPETGKR